MTKRLLFVLFLAAQSTIPVNIVRAQEPNKCDSCSVVQQAMQSLEKLHNSSTRKEVELNFELDGGPADRSVDTIRLSQVPPNQS